jgi:transcription termination/antitermination protein NusG
MTDFEIEDDIEIDETVNVTEKAELQKKEDNNSGAVIKMRGAEKKSEPVVVKDTKTIVLNAPKKEEVKVLTEKDMKGHLYVIRTTANREDQVFDFLESNIAHKKINIFSIVRAHGMRGYIFIEAADVSDAQRAIFGVPYARGILDKPVDFKEIEHMLETVKKESNIRKGDIVEIISGPFKRENARISRVDKEKEEVVVELLEAAVSIPITLKFDAVKVIRREEETEKEEMFLDE